VARNSGGVNVPVSATWNGRALKTAESQLGSFRKSFGKAFLGMGAAAGAALGVGALVDKMGQAVGAASDLVEAQGKVNVVFGASSRAVSEWADTSATSMLMSKQAALEAAGTYGNLFQAFGIGQEQARGMSQELVGLAADLASFNNTSVDDAIQALRSGLSGETEPLKRYGVALTDVRLRAEAMSMGIYDGVGVLNSAQKAQASYALILKDTRLAQGDVERTADNYANTMRAVEAAVQNAQATIGGELVNSIQSMSQAMGGAGGAVDAIDSASDSVADFIAGIRVGVTTLEDMIDKVQGLDQASEDAGVSVADVAYQVTKSLPGYNLLINTWEKAAEVGGEARTQEQAMNDEIQRSMQMRSLYVVDLGRTRAATIEATKATEDQRTALERLSDSMDKINGKNRSVIGQRMDLREGFAEGPTGTMVGKGKNQREVISPAQAKRWALDQAATAESLAEAIRDKGGEGSKARARAVVENANERIASQLRRNGVNRPQAFANSILATSGELQPGSPGTKRGGPQGGVTYIYQFGDIKVTSSDALTQVQQQATRLAALAGSRYSGMADSKKGYQ
jgi:hypothetical protein